MTLCTVREGCLNVKVTVEIPDEIGRVLASQAGDVSRAALEAVAVEAYRAGTITPAQMPQMPGLQSRWETEASLRRAEAYHDYSMDDLEHDIAAICDASTQSTPSRTPHRYRQAGHPSRVRQRERDLFRGGRPSHGGEAIATGTWPQEMAAGDLDGDFEIRRPRGRPMAAF
jgi:Uncharacterised protein family (UPF0175)